MTSIPNEHHWVVDGIEEGMARVEEDGERVLTLPLWLLPPGIREGQMLRVVRAGGEASSVLTITVDVPATAAALLKSHRQVAEIAKESKKRDAGGNVAL